MLNVAEVCSPISPAHMDWSTYYPAFTAEEPAPDEQPDGTDPPTIRRLVKDVEIADIGCGFGGLLVALGPRLPDQLLLGR